MTKSATGCREDNIGLLSGGVTRQKVPQAVERIILVHYLVGLRDKKCHRL